MQIPRSQVRIADDRTSVSAEALKRSILNHLFYLRGKLPETATPHDYYVALVQTIRDRLLSPWLATNQFYGQQRVKRVGYFSSAQLSNTLLQVYLTNLGIADAVSQAIKEFGLELESLVRQEGAVTGTEAGGQRMTDYLDALTTLSIPAIGYGIRYEQDRTESCLCGVNLPGFPAPRPHIYNAWEISRPEQTVAVHFGGTTEAGLDEQGQFRVRWLPAHVVWGIPYDVPVSGYETNTVNTLRLWSAAGIQSLSSDTLQSGLGNSQAAAQSLGDILQIPCSNLDSISIQLTQLQQQFFLISCSLQDILRLHCVEAEQPIDTLPEAFTLQLQALHQAIAIPELMRLLVDEHRIGWEQAWQITQNVFVYTHCASALNSTVHWDINLFGQLLPRHLEIIYEINRRFVAEVQTQSPPQAARVERMSLIAEGETRQIRIAHLTWVGSYQVNHTALWQSRLLKQESLQDFAQMFPGRFQCQLQQGIAHRSVMLSNPPLSDLISRSIGKGWTHASREMRQLELLLENPEFCQAWRSIKQSNKQAFTSWIFRQQHLDIDPNSLFDVHYRSIALQKRPLLSLFYIITLYNRIKGDPAIEITPRTFLFNEKIDAQNSDSTYELTRSILQLIHAVGAIVHDDPDVRQRLKVVCFDPTALPDSVPLTPGSSPLPAPVPTIYAVADLAEQLEVADLELVDPSSLKFALNGGLTISTLTASTAQFCDHVGEGNCFWFGLTAEEVMALRESGYAPLRFYHNHRELQGVIDRIAKGYFSTAHPNPFQGLIDTLLDRDEHLLLADYPFYVHCQDRLDQIYSDPERWTQLSILNTARMGELSWDRIIHDYCQEIWRIHAVPIQRREFEWV